MKNSDANVDFSLQYRLFDSQLIVSVQDDIYSLANGCICCTVQTDLIEQIAGLMNLREGAPEYVLIETSGVSDPARVAHTLQYPRLRGHVTLDSVISVVDAEKFNGLEGDMARLAMDQLDAADVIVINKTDLVTRPEIEALKAEWFYPNARIIETTHGQVPVELLVSTRDLELDGPSRAQSTEMTSKHRQDVTFDTWSWSGPGKMSLDKLRAFLAGLPVEIYRAKGIFDVAELPDQRAELHLVGSRTQLTRRAPWGDKARQNQAVVIGANGAIDPQKLQSALMTCLEHCDASVE